MQNYDIHEQLGIGAIGTVVKAIHKLTNDPVAIKIYHNTIWNESTEKCNWHRSIKLWKKLIKADPNHRYVSWYTEIISDFSKKDFRVVMPLHVPIKSHFIFSKEKKWWMDETEKHCVSNFLRHLQKAIQFIAGQRIMHSDLHLENVMINSSTNMPIVIDFDFCEWMKDCDLYYSKGFVAKMKLLEKTRAFIQCVSVNWALENFDSAKNLLQFSQIKESFQKNCCLGSFGCFKENNFGIYEEHDFDAFVLFLQKKL